MTVGRNFNEILRVLDSIQLNASLPLATPEGWELAIDDVVVSPALSTEEAKQRFGEVKEVLCVFKIYCTAKLINY